MIPINRQLIILFLSLIFSSQINTLEQPESEQILQEVPSSEQVSEEIKSVNVNELEGLESYINLTETTTSNLTVAVTNTTEVKNISENFVSCIPHNGTSEVHLVNDTELIQLLLPDLNITSKETPATCIVIMFYSKYCPFSSMAAPHFNALPRAFPTIKMVAINAMWYHIFNAQNGVVGVPSFLLFHNGKPVAKFNESDYTLELFSKFITKNTGISAEEKSFVTSADFSGPVVSVPLKDNDRFLLISWIFVLVCIAYYFSKSRFWKWIVETVQNTWRESEAQHEHEE